MDVGVKVDQVAEGLHEQDESRAPARIGDTVGLGEQARHDAAEFPEERPAVGEERPRQLRNGEDVLPVRRGAIGVHAQTNAPSIVVEGFTALPDDMAIRRSTRRAAPALKQRGLRRGLRKPACPHAVLERRAGRSPLRMPNRRQEDDRAPPFPGARLIRKVYEAHPLVCPKYQGQMRVIAPPAPARARCVITPIAQRANPRRNAHDRPTPSHPEGSARLPRSAGWMIFPIVSIGYSTDTISRQCPDSSCRARQEPSQPRNHL